MRPHRGSPDNQVPRSAGQSLGSRHVRAGETATAGFELAIAPEQAGWGFSGLRVLALGPGGSHAFDTGEDELIVLPLNGACSVSVDGQTFTLEGRDGVFSAVTDFAYAPRNARVEIGSAGGGRFALPCARAQRRLEPRRVPAEDVAVELRGAGRASRQVNNFCAPEAFEADRLIAVEVLTPAGNWSSYPPHKHDEERPGEETALEEIYYFEVSYGPEGTPGFAYQRVYGSGPGHEIDVCAEVRSGDMVVMPHGYHGPSMAAPGYDLYYLNVMAGPGERAWRFTDDPDHAWIRRTWEDQELDPRLPMTSARRHA
jgi:5-deoxy-glucuronate isomerase